MFKKAIPLLMICAMLIPLSTAVAAEEQSVQPTVEEILNRYHQKAFEERNAEQNGTASTYSRRAGSEKTLEQETVDELTAAGYEAYNVTPESYSDASSALNTDLNSMGLNPEYSYIVVVSGKEANNGANSSNSRAVDLPPHYEAGDDGLSNSFYHTYNGFTKLLRYVTITGADDPRLAQVNTSVLTESPFDEQLEAIFNTALFLYIDKKFPKQFIGTIASFLGIELIDVNSIQQASYALHAGTNWQRTYIQIYNDATSTWESWACFESATLRYYVSGYYYDAANDQNVQDISDEVVITVKTEHFSDFTWQTDTVIDSWSKNEKDQFEYIGDVIYYYDGKAVITHKEFG